MRSTLFASDYEKRKDDVSYTQPNVVMGKRKSKTGNHERRNNMRKRQCEEKQKARLGAGRLHCGDCVCHLITIAVPHSSLLRLKLQSSVG